MEQNGQYERDTVALRNQYEVENSANDLVFRTKINVFAEARKFSSCQIICTIGPACKSKEILQKMVINGMNIARLNFSHGDHAYHKETIDLVREVAQSIKPHTLAIALDTKGPEIRTGNNANKGSITFETGKKVLLTCDDQFKDSCTDEKIYLDYKALPKVCKPEQTILLADGTLILKVVKVTFEKEVECKVMSGATIGSRKNCCIPGVPVELPSVSEKDISDIKFAIHQKLDIIFASFIRNGKNIREIKDILFKNGANVGPDGKELTGLDKDILVIAKIENFEGVTNIDEIIEESDGIMVARGDLGMDLPLAKVVAAQKMIIAKCNMAGKPVICATQMMESMIHNIRPTRAEVSDVGNAVLDGADCVMLSGETANGSFPDYAVLEMKNTCTETEEIVFYKSLLNNFLSQTGQQNVSKSVSMASANLAFMSRSEAILVLSTSGSTAKYLSHYRPRCPIVVVTRSEKVAKHCLLYRGLFPVVYPKPFPGNWEQDVNERRDFGLNIAKQMGIVMVGSNVLFVCGWQKGPGFSNNIKVLTIGKDDVVSGITKSESISK